MNTFVKKLPKWLTIRSTVTKQCVVCNGPFIVPPCHAARTKHCSAVCQAVSRRGPGVEFNGRWYGINQLGYYARSRGKGLLHRHIWEHTNGPIPRGYVVHHKNGIKTDNRLENLAMLSKAEHDALHHQERMQGKRAAAGPLAPPQDGTREG